MLRQILNIYAAEVTQTCVQGDKRAINALNLHPLEQVLREVHTCRRGYNSTLLLGKNCLITLCILRLNLLAHPAWQRSLAEAIEGLLELLIRTIVEETQCTTARSGIVNNLCSQNIILAKVELIADTNLTRRIYQHIPQSKLTVELTKQENFNLGTGLLLISIEASRKYLCIVKDKAVFLLKIVENIFKDAMLNLARISMYDNKARLITINLRILCYKFRFKVKSVM